MPPGELRAIAQTLPGHDRWWASAGAGIAHWAVGGDATSVLEVRARVEQAGGSLVMLAAPDDFMRQVEAWGKKPKTQEIMRRLRRAFDPNSVLNPGRFVA